MSEWILRVRPTIKPLVIWRGVSRSFGTSELGFQTKDRGETCKAFRVPTIVGTALTYHCIANMR